MKIYDELTGLYNGEGFYGKVEEYLAEGKDNDYQIIRFDIKNFKFVNAIFGRRCGDLLLAEIGDTLKEHDYPEEVCGRLDSDRFAVFAPSRYENNLIHLISDTRFQIKGNEDYPIHICMGIYHVNQEECSVSEMCDRAGMALGTIKNNLMEKLAYYDDSMYEKMLEEHELSLELPQAIDHEELKLYLQPQIDRKGATIGAEALVRWQNSVRGMLMPGQFIPVFEKNYMIVEVDRYVWEQACRLLRRWEDDGRDDMYVSVNVSPKDFECIDVYDTLIGLVRKYDISPGQLKVEVTESTIMQNPMKQLAIIGKLRNAGFCVEMDDFGSGYSSISMLKDIDVDAIKMDMRFLSSTHHSDRAGKILKCMVELIREFDMEVIVEGVETRHQIDFLTDIGCELFQGFYFSRPVPVDDFEKRVFFHEN
jgi:diguanylate cyclase (GGDEF)-like protein